jgi:hypothetical protein
MENSPLSEDNGKFSSMRGLQKTFLHERTMENSLAQYNMAVETSTA